MIHTGQLHANRVARAIPLPAVESPCPDRRAAYGRHRSGSCSESRRTTTRALLGSPASHDAGWSPDKAPYVPPAISRCAARRCLPQSIPRRHIARGRQEQRRRDIGSYPLPVDANVRIAVSTCVPKRPPPVYRLNMGGNTFSGSAADMNNGDRASAPSTISPSLTAAGCPSGNCRFSLTA